MRSRDDQGGEDRLLLGFLMLSFHQDSPLAGLRDAPQQVRAVTPHGEGPDLQCPRSFFHDSFDRALLAEGIFTHVTIA